MSCPTALRLHNCLWHVWRRCALWLGLFRIMGNGKLRNCRIQSAAALWLRHSFARAFSGDS
ncbi:MAG: hypothetical protein K2N70_02925 [Helicobacter sp.]|nr:hypothetical protein [Helicobacter sp.]